MATKTPTNPTAKRNAIALAIIATVGSVAVALIKVLPPLFADKQPEPSKPLQAAITPLPVVAPITVTGDGSTQTVVTGDKSTVTVHDNKRVESFLERGLPESDHPVVNLARPIEAQIQVFPEDKIEVVGWSDRVEAIWLGNQWETVTPNSQRVYTVWGPAGEPVTPKFRGQGEVKLSISFTKNRGKPRDLRDRRPNEPVSKP
jgi:hypothetical protein